MSLIDMNYVITLLEVQKRNPKRVNVHLDGKYAFSLASIVAAWLTEGRKLDDSEIEILKSEDYFEVASQLAMKYLAYKPRTAHELKERLQKANTPDQIVERLLSRFKDTGLINDERYAREWVEMRQKNHPRSSRMMMFELIKKGIDRNIIENAMNSVMAEEDLAYALANQKKNRFINLEYPIYKKRLAGFLGRRGFSYDVVNRVIERLWIENRKDKNMN